MYISSPIYARRVLLRVSPNVPEGFQPQAGTVLSLLQESVSQVGIPVTFAHADDQPCDLILCLSASQSCATLAYNWINWRQNRKLADLIAEELRAATGLVPSEGRVSLTLGRGAGAPVLELSLPTQATWSPESVAQSLFRGLARCWNYPLQEADPENPPEPDEATPQEESEDERIILPTAPITSQPLLLRPAPPPAESPDPPPVPAPAPAPAPATHNRTKAASPRAVPFVISQARFSTRLVKATQQGKR